MIDKAKALLQKYPFHSKVLVIVFFAIVFLILIIATLGSRVSEENTAINPTPTPQVLVPGEDYVEGQVMAKFKEGISDIEINNILSEYDSKIESTIDGINVKVIEVPIGQEEVIINNLINQGVVEYAEFNHTASAVYIPNDKFYDKQYGLKNIGQDIRSQNGKSGSDVKAEAAWDITKGSSDIRVAVVDTGIDSNHPDFSEKIVGEKVFSTNSIKDGHGHGTHVAGIIAANANNSEGIAGICPECKLLIAKSLNDSGSGDDAGISNGIIWAADNGAKVINVSIVMNNGIAPQTLKDAVKYAWDKGAVIVAAAGNCGNNNYSSNGCNSINQVLYPAAFSEVVSVANLDNKDDRSSTSNHGTWIDLAAAGQDIISTMPTYSNYLGVTNYGYMTGTSMASPLVAGIAGLIWSTPHGTSNQAVVDRLLSTTSQIPGIGTNWKNGRVNAEAAVKSLTASPTATLAPTPTLTQDPDPTVTPTPTSLPTPTVVPNITPTITVTPKPQEPPPFVCGGSRNSVCITPIITIPPELEDPNNDCIDPRSPREKIIEWANRHVQRMRNYFNIVFGNPQNPLPPPPIPCVNR